MTLLSSNSLVYLFKCNKIYFSIHQYTPLRLRSLYSLLSCQIVKLVILRMTGLCLFWQMRCTETSLTNSLGIISLLSKVRFKNTLQSRFNSFNKKTYLLKSITAVTLSESSLNQTSSKILLLTDLIVKSPGYSPQDKLSTKSKSSTIMDKLVMQEKSHMINGIRNYWK